MKPLINIVVAILLVAAPAARAALPNSPPQSTIRDYDYRGCVTSDECIAFSVPCGTPIAINGHYRTVVESWYDYMNAHVSCSSQRPNAYSAPVCREGRCILAP